MRNPFLKSFNFFLVYLSAWVLVLLAQAEIIYSFSAISFERILQQTFISNFIFAFLLLSFWYVVKFIRYQPSNRKSFVLNHFVLTCIFFFLWFVFCSLLFRWTPDAEEHKNIFKKLLPLFLFTGALVYVMVLLVYYLFLYLSSFNEKVEREADLYKSVKDTELQLLKSQLHPHFIFNSLNSVNALLHIDVDAAQNMLLKLAGFLRSALEGKEINLVSLEEEMDYARLYLDIERVRFGDRLLVQEQIEPEALQARLPHMLLQPLYENVVKHGLGKSLGSVRLNITAVVKDDQLLITLSNNFEVQNTTPERKGLGIRNVQKRLTLQYGRKDCFQIFAKDKFYKVHLSIPQIPQQ